jgi:hypothetical protein
VTARIGIDLERPVFEHSAMRLHPEQEGQGLVLYGGKGGQIYADKSGTLTLESGNQGFRVVGPDGTEAIRVGPGDKVALISIKLDANQFVRAFLRDRLALLTMLGDAFVLFLPLQVIVTYLIVRRRFTLPSRPNET